MIINSKVRYGLRTMLEIANATESTGVLVKDIAESQNISLKYLNPIIAALRVKGLITTSKGKGKGYRLTRDPNEITMYDIYTAFEQINIVECINNHSYCEPISHICTSKNYWKELKNEFILLLQSKTLAQILKETHYECHILV